MASPIDAKTIKELFSSIGITLKTGKLLVTLISSVRDITQEQAAIIRSTVDMASKDEGVQTELLKYSQDMKKVGTLEDVITKFKLLLKGKPKEQPSAAGIDVQIRQAVRDPIIADFLINAWMTDQSRAKEILDMAASLEEDDYDVILGIVENGTYEDLKMVLLASEAEQEPQQEEQEPQQQDIDVVDMTESKSELVVPAVEEYAEPSAVPPVAPVPPMPSPAPSPTPTVEDLPARTQPLKVKLKKLAVPSAAAASSSSATKRDTGPISKLDAGTVIHRKNGKLDESRYELGQTIGKHQILLVDIESCNGNIYPVTFYLAEKTKMLDVLVFIDRTISTVATRTDFECVRGQNFIITEYTDHTRYLYVSVKSGTLSKSE